MQSVTRAQHINIGYYTGEAHTTCLRSQPTLLIQLCLAARNEEKRLIELVKRQQYHSHATPSSNPAYSLHRRLGSQTAEQIQRIQNTPPPTRWQVDRSAGPRRCYNCGKPGHLSWEYCARRMESSGRGSGGTRPGDTRQIQTTRMDGGS